jgi:hypothetical protein
MVREKINNEWTQTKLAEAAEAEEIGLFDRIARPVVSQRINRAAKVRAG